MNEDNYQYTIKPLPPLPNIGGDAFLSSQVATNPSLPTVSNITPYQSPFSNPDFTGGGGGGGGGTPTCADDWTIGTIRTTQVQLPCSGGVQGTLTDSGLAVTSGSKTLIAELDGSNNQIFIDQGSKSMTFDPDELTDDGNDMRARELDVCHGGMPSKRVFMASVAYAP